MKIKISHYGSSDDFHPTVSFVPETDAEIDYLERLKRECVDTQIKHSEQRQWNILSLTIEAVRKIEHA